MSTVLDFTNTELFAKGMKNADIARMYNVTVMTTHGIKSNKTWKHIS